MFVAIYDFRVKPGQDAVFVKGWEAMTAAIFKYRGSLGSRLHKGEDGQYIAYAQWPSEEQFESDIPLPAEALAARELMKNSCITQTLIHRLNVVADHLRPIDE